MSDGEIVEWETNYEMGKETEWVENSTEASGEIEREMWWSQEWHKLDFFNFFLLLGLGCVGVLNNLFLIKSII